MNFFDKYETMTFYLSIIAEDPDLGPVPLECNVRSKCILQFRKSYTPVIYYISPQVVYYGSYTEMIFDPKHTTTLISNLDTDEMLFINAKIG
jgi:hypothetical protein